MPTGTEFDDIKNKRTEFLLADHKRFAELFCRTEDLGDKRVDTLVKLVTIAVAAILALVTVSPEEQFFSRERLTLITAAAMVALYVLGIVTYVGVVRGNEAVNRWKVRLDMIRKVFKGELCYEEYEPFHGRKIPVLVNATFEDRIAGGRSPIVIVITVGMGGASACLLAYWFTTSLVIAFVVLVFVVALSGLLLYSIRKILVAHSRDVGRYDEHAKKILFKRIKGIWETYIGKPRKKIHPNQFREQLESALRNGILTPKDIGRMETEVSQEIKTRYPSAPIESKLERFNEFKEIVDEVLSHKVLGKNT